MRAPSSARLVKERLSQLLSGNTIEAQLFELNEKNLGKVEHFQRDFVSWTEWDFDAVVYAD
jgi:hypothetical protein